MAKVSNFDVVSAWFLFILQLFLSGKVCFLLLLLFLLLCYCMCVIWMLRMSVRAFSGTCFVLSIVTGALWLRLLFMPYICRWARIFQSVSLCGLFIFILRIRFLLQLPVCAFFFRRPQKNIFRFFLSPFFASSYLLRPYLKFLFFFWSFFNFVSSLLFTDFSVLSMISFGVWKFPPLPSAFFFSSESARLINNVDGTCICASVWIHAKRE